MSTQLPAFVYSPLPSGRYTRILEVERTDDENAPLSARLLPINLDDEDHISYAALSYTWGSPDLSEALIVNDAIMYITPNLAEGLRRFRTLSSLKWLWVDAVCINQKDDIEKTFQIPLMGSIYRDSSRVMIWLGDREDDINLVKTIRTLSRRISTKRDQLSEEELVDLRQSVRVMTLLPWFSRRWVIQELVLSPNASFFCGQIELAWQRLIEVVKYAFDDIDSKGDEPMETELHGSRNFQNFRNLEKLWLSWNSFTRPSRDSSPRLPWKSILKSGNRGLNSSTPSILYLLHLCDHFQCLDDRDRISSILELADDVNNNQVANNIKFTTDYTQSTDQVYTAFAVALVKAGFLLMVLDCASSRVSFDANGDSGLPSWVPDWRKDPRPSGWEWGTNSVIGTPPVPIRLSSYGKFHILKASLLCTYYPNAAANVVKEYDPDVELEEEASLNMSFTQFKVLWASPPFQQGSDWSLWVADAILNIWKLVLESFDPLEYIGIVGTHKRQKLWIEVLEHTLFNSRPEFGNHWGSGVPLNQSRLRSYKRWPQWGTPPDIESSMYSVREDLIKNLRNMFMWPSKGIEIPNRCIFLYTPAIPAKFSDTGCLIGHGDREMRREDLLCHMTESDNENIQEGVFALRPATEG